MNKVSMRVDYTLPKCSLEEQIRLASQAGVDAVETGDLMGYDCKRAGEAAAKYGIKFIACGFYDLIHTRVGVPYEQIKDSMEKTIQGAKDLGCNLLLSLTVDKTDRGEEARKIFVENMKPLVDVCVKNDMILVLEPHATKYVNPVTDMTRFFLNTPEIAYDVMDRINCPDYVKMLFDVYHCQTMAGDLFMNIKEHIDKIVHFHLAGVPGRDEPINGEVHYPNLIRYARRLGYDNYFGLEYYPKNVDDMQTLADMVSLVKKA